MQFNIRSMQEKDCSCITDLCRQLGYPNTEEEVKPRILDILARENHMVFVAETGDGRVIGWVHVHIYPLLETDMRAEIGGLVVDQGCRKYGAGAELMKNAEQWARGHGCSAVSLRSNAERKEAHIFYERIGYPKVKEQYTFRKKL